MIHFRNVYRSILLSLDWGTSLYLMPSHHVHDAILEHDTDDFFDGATTSPCSIQHLCLGRLVASSTLAF